MAIAKDNIKVEGHKGTWYKIGHTRKASKTFYLLEHEIYGEDANHIAVDSEGKLILEDITDGMTELREFLNEKYQG